MADRGDHGSLLREALRAITRAVAMRPRLALWIVVILCCSAVALSVTGLKFKTQRSDLIDPNAAFHQRWLQYAESFGDTSDIVIVVDASEPDTIKQVLDDLGRRLESEPEYFDNVLFKVEPNLLRRKGLHYLPPQQLEAGLNRVAEYKPVVEGRWDLVQLDSLMTRLRYQIEARGVQPQLPGLDPLLEHADLLSESLGRYVRDSRDFQSPWPVLLPVDPELREAAAQVVYLLNDDGTLGFLKARPVVEETDFRGAAASINRLDAILKDVRATFPGVTVSATGIPILEHDEMRRSQADMLKASVLSFVGVGLLLLLGFRGLRHPALALVMLAVGMCWAFGFATLTVGHLNILSVSFAAILIGLGIDFAIHYLARYLELRHEGEELRPALLKTSGSVGTGIVTAAVTTALAFFCATFTGFLGVAELGVIAAGGILVCVLATFLVLPSLITLADRDIEPKRLPTPFQLSGLRWLTSRYPIPVFAGSALAILGCAMALGGSTEDGFAWNVKYDYNLLNLQAEGLESVELQRRVFQNSDNSLLFAVSVADTADEARALRAKFEALPTVHHVEDLATRLPQNTAEETALLVQGFHAYLAHLPAHVPKLPTPDPAQFGRAVERLYLVVRRLQHPRARHVAAVLDRFLDDFDRLSLRSQMAFLTEFQMRSTAALLGQFQAIAAASDPEPVQVSDLPEELRSRFVSSEGKWLLQIYPNEQIWDIEPLSRFVADVRSVDPEVTGTPLQNFEASRQIMRSYELAAWYALAVICLVLLVDFLSREQWLLTLLPPAVIVGLVAVTLRARTGETNVLLLSGLYLFMVGAIAALLDPRNLRDMLLTLLPPLGGGLLMFSLFALFGIDLNPANLIVLPLVLGIGVDDGVHVIHDYRLQSGRYRTSSSTMNAIVLTSLTTMIGFGSLLLASHRGLASVGLVMVIGVGSCLFVSLVMLPAGLTLVSRWSSGEKAETEAAKSGRKAMAA